MGGHWHKLINQCLCGQDTKFTHNKYGTTAQNVQDTRQTGGYVKEAWQCLNQYDASGYV